MGWVGVGFCWGFREGGGKKEYFVWSFDDVAVEVAAVVEYRCGVVKEEMGFLRRLNRPMKINMFCYVAGRKALQEMFIGFSGELENSTFLPGW